MRPAGKPRAPPSPFLWSPAVGQLALPAPKPLCGMLRDPAFLQACLHLTPRPPPAAVFTPRGTTGPVGAPLASGKPPKRSPESSLLHIKGVQGRRMAPEDGFPDTCGCVSQSHRGRRWRLHQPSLPRSLRPRALCHAHRHSGLIGAFFAPWPSALRGSQELEEDRTHTHTEAGGRRGQGQRPLDDRGRLIQVGKEKGGGPGRRGQQAGGTLSPRQAPRGRW